jgi:2-pyrone-4,6-dicarboxylate lactonase
LSAATNERQAEPKACPGPLPTTPPTLVQVPPGAWDVHAHVIGGDALNPLVAQRAYTPPPASPAAYLGMLDAAGFEHGVIVQISVHGSDNRLLVDAVRQHPERLRGVVVIDGSESDAALEDMREAGIRGVRINELFAGGSGAQMLQALAARCRPLGWHLDLALHGHRLRELKDALRALDITLVIDHMGWCPTALGVDHPDFQAVLELARLPKTWVKLSGAYRMSAMPHPYPDAGPFVQALVAAAPDRTVWGSDWPHVALSDASPMPQPGALVDALYLQLGGDAAAQRQLQAVLVDNPARLYGGRPEATGR